MKKRTKITVESQRSFSAHHMLLSIAGRSLESAEAKEPGWGNHLFISITFCALSIEALCNTVGERVFEDWSDYESCSPMSKVRILCKNLGVAYESDQDPWRTLIWLSKVRNGIAHAKPEKVIQTTKVDSHEAADALHWKAPKSKLENEFTLPNARRATKAMKMLLTQLYDAMPEEKKFGIYGDMWSSSSQVERDGG